LRQGEGKDLDRLPQAHGERFAPERLTAAKRHRQLSLQLAGAIFAIGRTYLCKWSGLYLQLAGCRARVRDRLVYPRFVENRLKLALTVSRVVTLTGPRQSGKTTMVRALTQDGRDFLTFDDVTTLQGARADPVGFIRRLDRAVIDEVQRVPEVLLSIKQSVDEDKRPGRFLLTGSANILTLPKVGDSLTGRTAIVQLLPLSQNEIRGTQSRFMADAFSGKVPRAGERLKESDLVARVLAGGYPEPLEYKSLPLRRNWYLDYAELIIQRDIRDIARIDRFKQLPRLLRILAQHAGQLANYSSLGVPVRLSHSTTQKYIDLFEQVFLVWTLQPWHTNELKRLTKTPKLHFLDSGLLAALRGLTAQRLQADRKPFGALLETFVLAEIRKLASWSEERFEFFHFRDKDMNEVDIVIEDQSGRIVGIEVKAAATVRAADFSGLRKLAEASGKRFVLGLVLYDHDHLVPFGEKMFAAPISTLWG
jgi:predicted AAA+ superfamily ATPase